MAIFTFEHQWEAFKVMAAEELYNAHYKRDLWGVVSCLDMSFEEEYLNTDIETWRDRMVADIEEMKKDCPEDFL
ncbi:hypothetical protein rtp56 [Escherichia phage Rtp]|uniref:Uncharacterized protein n=1 Tax=Escherichia phage Rtp TaxID=2994041 RepID=Q333C8_9CAUD|nr:hypothetical protein rtp56 [Escherichia phage Rtp]CAJ42260.1 hypothetical protein [Escherichia phage Rtp]